MMITSTEKLNALRAEIKAQGLDGFIVPLADEYQGEFTASYAQRLRWLTDFTGSGGVAAVLADRAIVLTDGRYMIQITQQVDGECFETGNMITDPLENWLSEYAGTNALIGYDPWLHTPAQIKKFKEKGLALKAIEQNPIDSIWQDQPSPPKGAIEIFSDEIAGQSARQKKALIEKSIADAGAQACILSLPDSICWLLNLRGTDIECTPSILSYAVIYADGRPLHWVVDPDKITPETAAHLNGVAELLTPQDLPTIIGELSGAVMLDFSRTPQWFKAALEAGSAVPENTQDPCIEPKSIKTPSEQAAIKAAHDIDAIALVKFLHWVDQTAAPGRFTEMDAAAKIESFRAENPAFRTISFPTIAGFGENGAIIHYRATKEANKTIEGAGLLLVDSGGQYCAENGAIAGTTDITRTIAIGQPSAEMRERFTLVLKGHIGLAKAKFPRGTTGAQIDTLARQALWNAGLDYVHGTGHGVGCYLAVHEEAASISPRGNKPLKAGMLISNEPGYYKQDAYGIRIENILLVKEASPNEDNAAPMLKFETISLAPIDSTLIIASMLDKEEKSWLNAYHQRVYECVSPHIGGDIKQWLKEKTAPV